MGSMASFGTGGWAGSLSPNIRFILREHAELRHVVVDDEHRQLDDLRRTGAQRFEHRAEIRVGVRDLLGEVGREAAGRVLSALPRD